VLGRAAPRKALRVEAMAKGKAAAATTSYVCLDCGAPPTLLALAAAAAAGLPAYSAD
jgi:hypothetical protein